MGGFRLTCALLAMAVPVALVWWAACSEDARVELAAVVALVVLLLLATLR